MIKCGTHSLYFGVMTIIVIRKISKITNSENYNIQKVPFNYWTVVT
jgi:hypothetical protein